MSPPVPPLGDLLCRLRLSLSFTQGQAPLLFLRAPLRLFAALKIRVPRALRSWPPGLYSVFALPGPALRFRLLQAPLSGNFASLSTRRCALRRHAPCGPPSSSRFAPSFKNFKHTPIRPSRRSQNKERERLRPGHLQERSTPPDSSPLDSDAGSSFRATPPAGEKSASGFPPSTWPRRPSRAAGTSALSRSTGHGGWAVRPVYCVLRCVSEGLAALFIRPAGRSVRRVV